MPLSKRSTRVVLWISLALTVISSLGFLVTTLRLSDTTDDLRSTTRNLHSYQVCVAQYIQAIGEASVPRSNTSAAVQETLHVIFVDIFPHISGPPADPQQVKEDVHDYLRAYHQYTYAVSHNPPPPLPDCLRKPPNVRHQ